MPGGTTLVILMKQRALRFSYLVDLQSIPGLDRITETDGGLSIGALATHRSVERSSLVSRYAPALVQAFSHVGNVRIRETASVGGNLAHADYRLDPPPVLLVLGAEVVLSGARGDPGGGTQGLLPRHVRDGAGAGGDPDGGAGAAGAGRRSPDGLRALQLALGQ